MNIYDCQARKQDFSKIENAFVRMVNIADNKELARFNLSGQDYQGMTGMVLAEVYRHNGEWKMAAIGNGTNVNGIGELVKSYI